MKSRLEELRIVFFVQAHVKTRQKLGDRMFDILEAERLDELSVFRSIQRVLHKTGAPTNFRTRDGTPISEKQVEEQIRTNGKWIPYVQIGGLGLYASSIPARRQAFIIMEEKSEGAVSSWDEWVSPFLGWPNFVHAWVADVEYTHWQNAADPLEYTVVGRDMTGLRMTELCTSQTGIKIWADRPVSL